MIRPRPQAKQVRILSKKSLSMTCMKMMIMGPRGITNPVPPNEGEGSNTNEIANDSDNYVEVTEYTNEIANDSGNYVEVTEYTNEIANDSNNYLEDCNITEHVGIVEEGAEHDINNEVEATKNGKETSSSEIDEQSNVGPAKNGTPSIEIIKVVDEIVDNNSQIENNVAVEGAENMETAVSEVPPALPNPVAELQTKYEGRSLSRKAKSIATAVRVFRHASQPSLPSQLRGVH